MNQIIGHSQNIHMLKKAFFSEKLSHAYLFSGIEGIGKRTVAKAFAKLCLCESIESEEPCN
ncbi:DNA polymerase III subunit delta', partial [Peptococcaceae bacterium]|nr:DNA polymerase III subunit delta' [Peptococcaceae bacterium]